MDSHSEFTGIYQDIIDQVYKNELKAVADEHYITDINKIDFRNSLKSTDLRQRIKEEQRQHKLRQKELKKELQEVLKRSQFYQNQKQKEEQMKLKEKEQKERKKKKDEERRKRRRKPKPIPVHPIQLLINSIGEYQGHKAKEMQKILPSMESIMKREKQKDQDKKAIQYAKNLVLGPPNPLLTQKDPEEEKFELQKTTTIYRPPEQILKQKTIAIVDEENQIFKYTIPDGNLKTMFSPVQATQSMPNLRVQQQLDKEKAQRMLVQMNHKRSLKNMPTVKSGLISSRQVDQGLSRRLMTQEREQNIDNTSFQIIPKDISRLSSARRDKTNETFVSDLDDPMLLNSLQVNSRNCEFQRPMKFTILTKNEMPSSSRRRRMKLPKNQGVHQSLPELPKSTRLHNTLKVSETNRERGLRRSTQFQDIASISSIMDQSQEELKDIKKYVSTSIPNGIRNINTIQNTVGGVSDKFEELRIYQGPILQAMYNEKKINELDTIKDAKHAVHDFHNVPSISVYEQVKQIVNKQKQIQKDAVRNKNKFYCDLINQQNLKKTTHREEIKNFKRQYD